MQISFCWNTMAQPEGKIDVVCQNPRCPYHWKEAGKDIIKGGKCKSTGQQGYYCKHCRTYLMEAKGTPLYWKQLPENEIINIYKHLVGFSKLVWELGCSFQVFQFYCNFINGFKRRISPAMLGGLLEHLLDIARMFLFPINYLGLRHCDCLGTKAQRRQKYICI